VPTAASIPHSTKGKNILEMRKKIEEAQENKYQARPPTIVHPHNPEVSPQSYEPKINGSKPAQATVCKDAFSSSKVERTIQWEEDRKKKEYARDKNVKPHKSSLIGASSTGIRQY
jgi:hypothetical protein